MVTTTMSGLASDGLAPGPSACNPTLPVAHTATMAHATAKMSPTHLSHSLIRPSQAQIGYLRIQNQ